jgi:hypothetical protein
MNEILILMAQISLVIAVLLLSAFAGKFIAKKLDKSIWLFFLTGLFTGPIGLIFLFIIFKLPEKLVGLFVSFFVFLIIAVLFTQTTILSGLEWGSIDFRFYLRDPSQLR